VSEGRSRACAARRLLAALTGLAALAWGAPSVQAAPGFDVALDALSLSGAVSFDDDFEDGQRDAGPTAALIDRGATRTHERDGALVLTHADGADLLPEASSWVDRVSLDRPLFGPPGPQVVEARFRGVPSVPGQGFGILLEPAGRADVSSPLTRRQTPPPVSIWVETSEATTGGLGRPLTLLERVFRYPNCGGRRVVGKVSVSVLTTGFSSCRLLDRDELADGITLRLGIDEQGRLQPWFALGQAAFSPIAPPSQFAVAFPPADLPERPLRLTVLAQGPSGADVPPRSLVGFAAEGDVMRGPGDEIHRVEGGLFASRLPGAVASVPGDAVGRFVLEAAPGADVRVAPTRVRLDGPAGTLLAEVERVHRLLRRDLESGRAILPDAPAGSRCVAGTEAACVPSGHLRHESLALRAAFHDAVLADAPAAVAPSAGAGAAPELSPAERALLGRPPLMAPQCPAASVSSVGQTMPWDPKQPLDPGSSVRDRPNPFQSTSAFACSDSDATAFGTLGADAATLLQSWLRPGEELPLDEPQWAQPGTVGFEGGPLCRRFVDGQVIVLPGCVGPDDPGYDPDGGDPSDVIIGFPPGVGPIPPLAGPTLDPTVFTPDHPFTGQPWATDLASWSWNLQMVLASQSAPGMRHDPARDAGSVFDADLPFRPDACSYLRPGDCAAPGGIWAATVEPLPGDPEPLPALRFQWDGGASYRITEASGRFAELAGGWLHATGPVVSPAPGTAARVLFHAVPPPPVDADGDDVADARDRCLGTPDPLQRDSDGDGFGNRCDADLDGDGAVGFSDLARFRRRFLTADPHADLDGDGTVSFRDWARFRQLFGRAPGPSAVSSAE